MKSERLVSFETVMDNCERLLSDHAKDGAGIVDYGLALSRIGNRNEHDPVWSAEREHWIHHQAEAISELQRKYRVTFWTTCTAMPSSTRTTRNSDCSDRDSAFTLHGNL